MSSAVLFLFSRLSVNLLNLNPTSGFSFKQSDIIPRDNLNGVSSSISGRNKNTSNLPSADLVCRLL